MSSTFFTHLLLKQALRTYFIDRQQELTIDVSLEIEFTIDQQKQMETHQIS